MGKNKELTVLSLKEKIKALDHIIENEPVILLKGTGDILISDKAKTVIARRKINNDELLSWLRIGAQHLLSTLIAMLR